MRRDLFNKLSCRLIIILIVLSFIFIPACRTAQQPTFPELPGQETIPEDTKPEPSENEPIIVPGTKLTLAVPFGLEACEMLRLLFSGRKSGAIPLDRENLIGHSVQQSELLQYELPMEIILENVSWEDGVGKEQVDMWRAAGTMPDIIFSRNAAGVIGLTEIIDLAPVLSDNELFKPDNMFSGMLEGSTVDNRIYGIPYLVSLPLIIINQGWMENENIRMPQVDWSWHDFIELALQVQSRLDETGLGVSPQVLESLLEEPELLSELLPQSQLTLANPQELFRWLPPQLEKNAGIYGWQNGHFDLQDQAFLDTYIWTEHLLRNGLTLLHLEEHYREEAMLKSRIQIAKRSVFRIADSSELAWWHQQDNMTVSENFLPTGEFVWPLDVDDEETVLPDNIDINEGQTINRIPVNVRYLAIANNSEHADLAAEFAAFLALDIDSLLIQSRFQLYEGLFPAVRSEEVWMAMVSRQPFGSLLMNVLPELDNLYMEPVFRIANWRKATETADSLLLDILPGYGDEEQDIMSSLSEISSQMNRALRGD